MKQKSYCSRKMALLLVFVMLITSFCACSKTSDDDSTTTTSKSTTTRASDKGSDTTPEEYQYTGSAPVTQEKKKISIITHNSGSKILGFKDMFWWHEAIDRANIELEMEEIDSSSFGDVIKPRLAAGVDLTDIVALPDKDNNMAYIDSGLFIELTDYYEEYGYNLAKRFDEYKNLKAELTTPDGRIFYVPYINTSSDNSRCLMVHTGYMKQLGIPTDSLETLDDFYDYLVKVKNTDLNGDGDPSDEIPLFSRSGSIIHAWAMFWGLEILNELGMHVDENGKVICGYTDPRFLEYVTFMNKLYNEGLLYNEFPSANLDVQNAAWAMNQIGSLIHYISNCTGYSLKIDPDWDFYNDEPIMQPIIPPKGPYGHQHAYGRDALGRFFAISNTCEDPETAFCFMDYLYSDEVGSLTWYGFEGTDYNMENGEMVFTDKYLENVENYRGKAGYNFDGLPSYQLGYMSKECKFVRDMSSALGDYVLQPSVIFSFKEEDEREVLSAYSADLNTYFGENASAFILGTKQLSEWDDYLNEVESLHLSDVIAVYQAVADRSGR